MATIKSMKASTIALVCIGAAILVLGTVFVLTLPKEDWSCFGAFGETRLQDSGANGATGEEPRLGPGNGRYRGRADFGPRGDFTAGRGRRGGPGGFFFLALLVGMGVGFAAFNKRRDKPNGKEES
jgi:hypothetical protein